MEAVKTRTMSVCGVQCDACEHYPDICLGCKALEGSHTGCNMWRIEMFVIFMNAVRKVRS